MRGGLGFGLFEQHRHGAYRKGGGRERGDVETQPLECFLFGLCRGDVQRIGEKTHRNQQGLGNDPFGIQRSLELLINDALVRGVHVHHDQTLRILREDVNAGKLGQGKTEWRGIVSGEW